MKLKKIYSGGQLGADLGGLIAGIRLGLQTGGTMPKGFLTEDGKKPEFAKLYGMVEHASPQYPPRTFENVLKSSGTVRFASDFNSPGERCTLKAIKQCNKPYFDVDINNPPSRQEFRKWLFDNNIVVLNVAGNRESTSPGIGRFVEDYLYYAIKDDRGINYPEDQELRNILAEELRKLQETDPVRRATTEASEKWPEYAAEVVHRLQSIDDSDDT